MRITKYEHACFVLEEAGVRLVVDPGNFTSDLPNLEEVAAIVITHEHPDHWTPEQLTRLLTQSPQARVFGPAGVEAAATGFEVTVVHGGDEHEVGPFRLAFHGSKHAVIHSSIPVIDNVGVMINDAVFYPGDSFTTPPGEVDLLAVPAGAPWLKIAEVIDYVAAVRPRRSFPTHDAVLSDIGRGLSNTRIEKSTTDAGGTFHALRPGDTLEL